MTSGSATDMAKTALDDLTVATIITRWPRTIRVFLDLGMSCVGCPIGGFHTLAEAAEMHGLSCEDLESDLDRVIAIRGQTA
jgi:hybrid cluster-associated redox disulfide protein